MDIAFSGTVWSSVVKGETQLCAVEKDCGICAWESGTYVVLSFQISC